MRADAVAREVRDQIVVGALDGRDVVHYSIPNIEQFGGPVVEDGTDIQSGKLVVRGGELLVSRLNPRKGRVLLTARHDHLAVCSGEFVVLRPMADLDLRFAFYVFTSEYARQTFDSEIRSVTRSHQRAPKEAIYRLALPLPAMPVQRAIADFLDREMARIDRLMEKKRRLVELLGEKRTALISHAVTKGLDPAVPMKDSGIPWLGDIPAHWGANKIKYAAHPGTGHTPSRQHPEYWENCTVPWITLADVWQLRNGWTETIEDTNEKVSHVGLANSSAVKHPKGTVFFSRTASVGFSGVMGADMATSQDFVTWTCSEYLEPYYLLYVFRSMQTEFARLTMGSTHKTIYMPDALAVSGPLPPLDEQSRIVGFLRARLGPLRSAIEKLKVQIEKLAEYRQALITAAVTGQIDIAAERKDAEEVVA